MLQKTQEFHLFRWFDVIAVGVLAIFLSIVANIAWVFPILDEVETSAYSLLRAQAVNTENQITTFLKHDLTAIENGALLINRDLQEPEDVMVRLLRENPSLDSIILLDMEGNETLIKQSRFVMEQGILSEHIFKEVQKQETYLSGLLFNKLKQPTLEFGVPLAEETGFSTLVGQINLKFFIDEVFENLHLVQRNAVYIVDNDGYLLGHSNWQLVASRTNVMDRKLISLALKGTEADTRNKNLIYQNENNKEVFATAIPVDLTGWVVVVETPDDPALAAARRTLTVAAFSFVFEIILILLIIWIYFHLTRAARFFYRERNEREVLVNNLIDGVIEYDNDLRILLMNPKAEELLGVSFKEISDISLTPTIVETKPHLRALIEVMFPIFAPYASTRQKIPGSTARKMIVFTSQPKRTLEITMTQVIDENGATVGFLKILHDMTREAFLEKMKAEFVSIAAHQLRTPLSIMKWSMNLLLAGEYGKITKKQKEVINMTYQSNERMISLVDDLLNVARIEEGKFMYKPIYTHLEDVIKSVVHQIKAEHRDKKIEISFKKPKEKLPTVLIDVDAIKLAVQNLLQNAIQYTYSGGRVTISITPLDTKIKVTIEDTGIGISEDEKPRLFTKFFRSKRAVHLIPDRTGLGLFIVKNIIEAHKGKIWFSSEENKGSTFHFTLPIQIEEEDQS